MGGSYQQVAECPDVACPLHARRLGDGAGDAPEDAMEGGKPPIRAIRRQCLVCCGGDRKLARACAASPTSKAPFEPCILWRFRLGSRPELWERKKREARRTLLTLPGLDLHNPNNTAK